MIFDIESDVTIVLTSCGRFELLETTLSSLDKFNTYPIKKVIIVEDSGRHDVMKFIPECWHPHTEVLINQQQLGQIQSIDKAYSYVDSKYIFHCEDDWQFYRKEFIEDSKKILENDKNVLQVWLRDYDNDIRKHYSHYFASAKLKLDDCVYYKLDSEHIDWKGFSFNPGLRRKSDYDLVKPYYVKDNIAVGTESLLGLFYHGKGMYSVILAKSAVEHIGGGHHVDNDLETFRNKLEFQKRLKKKKKHLLIGFGIGVLTSLLLFSICRLIS